MLEEVTFKTEKVVLIETNLDDMNPEFYEYIMERLLAAGALDVWWTQITMKKSRPGICFSVLAASDRVSQLLPILFTETTTLGVRMREMERCVLARRLQKVPLEGGKVSVKLAYLGKQLVSAQPEYEDCKRLALQTGLPLRTIYERVKAKFLKCSLPGHPQKK